MDSIGRAPSAIARRIHLNRNLRIASAEATAILVSYPKSGRTWVRFILAHYFAAKARHPDLDTETMFGFAPNFDLDPTRGIPAFIRRADAAAVPLIPSTHSRFTSRIPPELPVLFVVRDPRDVMASSYHHVTRHKQSFTGDMDDFLSDNEQGLPEYFRFMNSWGRELKRRPHYVVSYEGLISDAVSEMARALQFLNQRVDLPALEQAVELSSFDKLRALELTKGIPGHAYDKSDPDALRMRRGKVGSFEDELSAAQKRLIEETCASQLSATASSLLSGYDLGPAQPAPQKTGVADRSLSVAPPKDKPATAANLRRRGIGRQLAAETMVIIGVAAALLAPAILAIELGEWWLQREWAEHSLGDGLALFGVDRTGHVETPTERILDVFLALPLTVTLFVVGILTLLSGVHLGDWGLDSVKLKKRLSLSAKNIRWRNPPDDDAETYPRN
ncbi:sulfotransferase domain-containing protein [Altererythrobacter sp. Root672]|uniref:sulfotransferase domain-containing protein n=1 Tax=Altererythrobacter sp. Root672 TaxID=1736584 RepID=UPI000A851BB7|nr:sulfotransferase domain-containing protein [Altererythrobacter sp. Root672]